MNCKWGCVATILIVLGVLVIGFIPIETHLYDEYQEQSYPLGAPEEAVQRYVRLLHANDVDAAFAMLTEETRTACAERFYRQGLQPLPGSYTFKIPILSTEELNENRVNVVAVMVYQNHMTTNLFKAWLFNDSLDDDKPPERDFQMLRDDAGSWLVAEADWPVRLSRLRSIRCFNLPEVVPSQSAEASSP